MSSVADSPDWSSAAGTPAQLIGKPIGASGTLLLGSDGTDARAILTDSSGRIKVSGGGSPAGTNVTHAAPFDHSSANLATGHTLVFNDGYTVAIGDILIDAWVEIVTGWNGTTPTGDFGRFLNFGDGGYLNASTSLQAVDMTLADNSLLTSFEGLLVAPSNASLFSTVSDLNAIEALLSAFGASSPYHLETTPGATLGRGNRYAPGKFSTADPMKFVVSQDGFRDGSVAGSTVGSAIFYMTTCTPA